jgi:hypothetical protein
MTKSAHNDFFDAALNVLKNTVDEMNLCSVAPTTYTEAITTYSLADIALASGDFTVADGDTSGRKVTVAAQTGETVDATGMATHIALVDAGASALLYVTELATVRQNTAQAGAASTITLDTGASAVDDFYNNMAITIVSGTGAGQTRYISDYVGSTKVATVGSAWGTNPAAGSVFRVYGQQLTAANPLETQAFDIEIADPA